MTKKQIRLLLLGLNVVVVAAIGVLIYLGPGRSSDAQSITFEGTTARAAFSSAADRAAQWRDDAALAVVSSQQSGRELQAGENVVWTFQFFSPSTQQRALIAVTEGEARLLRETVSPYQIPTFSKRDWRVDSDQALQTWWENGGSFLVTRRPSAQIVLHLRVPREEPQSSPVWTIVGVDFEQESTFTVEVDAVTGQRLEQ
jgi:hypothetical protein